MRPVLAVLLFSLAPAALAQVPRVISHEGRLLRADGSAERGSVTLAFALYPTATGGPAAWSESHNVTLSGAGYYAVQLGLQSALPAPLADAYWLGITVQGEQEMSPRARLAAAPYALRAAHADDAAKLGGDPSAQILRVTSALDASRLTGNAPASGTNLAVLSGGKLAGNVLPDSFSIAGTGTFGLLALTPPGSAPTCDASVAGRLFYDGAEKVFLGCDGTRWTWAAGTPVGATPSRPGLSCADIHVHAPYLPDGIYWIDPDAAGGLPLTQVVCDMTRDGGGWTLGIKHYYQSGMYGTPNGWGHPGDAFITRPGPYKLPDTIIRGVIGADNNFDVMADQVGHNAAYSNGNYEYVLLRNYTASFTFAALVPESSTTTTMESRRLSDGALAWTGRLGCGYAGGVGINCYPVLAGSVPGGGSGCTINMGKATDPGYHNFFMAQTNDDTYLYMCNGAQHSSSYNMSHRFWFR